MTKRSFYVHTCMYPSLYILGGHFFPFVKLTISTQQIISAYRHLSLVKMRNPAVVAIFCTLACVESNEIYTRTHTGKLSRRIFCE